VRVWPSAEVVWVMVVPSTTFRKLQPRWAKWAKMLWTLLRVFVEALNRLVLVLASKAEPPKYLQSRKEPWWSGSSRNVCSKQSLEGKAKPRTQPSIAAPEVQLRGGTRV